MEIVHFQYSNRESNFACGGRFGVWSTVFSEVNCQACINAAQHHAHQTPETQATPQAVINAETLEPSDSVPQSAQAQVA